ncbi:MAG TPA: zinc-binding dehydrogenase, partial [Roseiarcus sp.]|nr:zinc-binding dehydrogenase [Roseiarcus sp.]
MKAWRLEKLGGRLALEDIPVPEPRPGGVLVRVEATALLSYLKAYVEGKLPRYSPPPGPFTIGTGAVGTVEAVGPDVWRIRPGMRVALSPHFVAPENVEDPPQILIGLTAGMDAAPVLADWPDGALAEYALMPAEVVHPADGLEAVDSAQLAVVNRFMVPFGGLLRGRLAAGETLVVNGATGAFGTAAVLLGVAMGAARVVAIGRKEAALRSVAAAGGPRVSAVALTGDVDADVKAIRAASGGGAHIAFDIVGNAADPKSTLAGLMSLRRGGRLVAMGSLLVDLPVPYMTLMLNDWEILGQFMYPASAYNRLLHLVRAGLLDIGAITPRVFPLGALPEAMEAAAKASNLEFVAVKP